MADIAPPRTKIRRSLPYPLVFGLAVLLINILLGSFALKLLIDNRHQYEEEAARAAQNIATLTQRSLDDDFDNINRGLLAISDEVYRETADRKPIDKAFLNKFIARRDERYAGNGIEGFRLTDANGIVRYGQKITTNSGENISIANDAHFIYLKNTPQAETVLAKPSFSKINNKWIIRIVRRLNDHDGHFLGVASGIISINHFLNDFASLNIGKHGLITLRYADDLTIIARHPDIEKFDTLTGLTKTSPEFIEALRLHPDAGTLVSVSPFDDIERTLAYRRLKHWPLYIQVALSTNEFLVPWYQRIRVTFFASIVLTLSSILLVWYNYRYWRTRQAMAQSIMQNERLFRSLAKISSDWFWEQDKDFRFTKSSNQLTANYAWTKENYIGKRREDLALPGQEDLFAQHNEVLKAHKAFQNFEYRLIDGKGQTRTVSMNGEPIYDANGDFKGYRGTGRDITEKKDFESRILYMAQHDPLTDLPNRVLFYDRLHQGIQQARREHYMLALLYVDLDKFKPINDNYGHAAGDDALRLLAERLKGLLRESDTVARIGGDEFAVLLPKIASPDDAFLVARKIIEVATHPFVLDPEGAETELGVSIGIAIFPDSGNDEDQLFSKADAAMYKAKQEGNAYHYEAEI